MFISLNTKKDGFHMLISWLSSREIGDSISESFDEIVSTEILDHEQNLYLYRVVIKNMMYGPCGILLNPKNVCMKVDETCKDNYPKNFIATTIVENDCFL